MKIVVFDTETTSIEKPFVYNIGYVIYNTETAKVLVSRDYIVEQVWHNLELFTTAYYSEKRAEYISRMRGRTCEMQKLGYITQQMIRDFKTFEVEGAYAFNSPFDDNVFTFNCEWFKVKNPFDTIPIFDIRAYSHKAFAFTKHYKEFCDTHKYYTENQNYSTTAETVYRYITDNTDFIEEHTALADAEIELDILVACVKKGCEWNTEYKVYRSVPRIDDKELLIKQTDGSTVTYPYQKIIVYKEKENCTKIILKNKEEEEE